MIPPWHDTVDIVRGADLSATTETTRVRLGAADDTAPEILLMLAGDPAVTVRAAVAMNPATPGHVDSLLARDNDERVRTLLARKLATLLPSLSHSDRDALRERAMAMLTGLVNDEAVRVRTAIAEVLKDMPEAPRTLILRLAHDGAVAVSDPVIRLSPLLTAEDLLGLLALLPGPGTATSVARRAGLPETVAEAVAAGDDASAIAALLANSSATIREATLDALAERAADQTDWHLPLVQRPLLSERATRALSDIVTAQLLGALAERDDVSPGLAKELRTRVATRLRPEVQRSGSEMTLEDAVQEAKRLFAQERLDEDALLAATRRGEARLATAMLAVAADVPASVVDRAATLRSAKGLVSLVWKAGFSMRVAGPLQILLARLNPAAALRSTAAGGFPLAIEEMRWQIDFLRGIGR